MNKIIPFILVTAVSALFFMAVFMVHYYTGSEAYTHEKGPCTVDPGKTAALSGPWSFSWNTFLKAPDPAGDGITVRMPYHWHSFVESRGYPVYGRATYTYTLETKGMRGENALYIPAVGSACRLYINGELISESGVPAVSAETEKPSGKPMIAYFNQTGDTLRIALQVSNHAMYTGGFAEGKVEYGRPASVQTRYAVLLLGDAFLFLLLLFIGIISMYWFFYNRDEIHNAIFSIISIFYAFRVLLTGMMLIFTVSPWISVRVVSASISITYFFSLPLFLAYFKYSFPCEFHKWVPLSALVAATLFSVTSILFRADYQSYIITAFGVLVALGGVYSLICLFLAVKKGRANGSIVLVSTIIVMGCGLNDILYSAGLITSFQLMNAGIAVFGIMQVLVLSSSSRRTFRELFNVHHRLGILGAWQELFFATTARDLKKSLKGISDVSNSLLSGSLGPVNSDQFGGLSLISASSLQLSNMVNDVLDFRRIREGDIEVSRKVFNLYQLMDRVKTAVSLPFKEKALEFRNEIPRAMENLHADENLLERSFFNLARGFSAYADSGACVVSADTTDKEVQIEMVWDSEGLDKEKIVKDVSVFEAEHAEENEGDSSSAVITLSVARHVIEIQGGVFETVQETDRPVGFKITLPRMGSEVDQKTIEEEEAHLDALINLEPVLEDVVLTRNIDIMVVSADLMALQVMKSQLASMQYNVIPITSGNAALERIQEECPNLVLLDVHLNNESGYEICSRIREHWSSSELPIILITEKERVSDLMQGLTSGANDFLARPYHMEEFLTRVNTHIQLARINQMYSRFVPTEFLNTLGQENIIDLKLGDQVQREMTVLFVDIRAFTNLSENMTPQENFKFINSYLSRFSPMITRNNGFVDKFIGDAIMALYPGKPEDAIQTALEMVEHVKVYNGHRAKCGYKAINIGIGIHTGNLILGIIGDNQRMQGTVISDAVNLASRIQDVTKLYHTSVVISQETFVKLENPMSYDFRFLGKVKVKGKAKSVSLFEIFNCDIDEMKKLKSETKNDFETAIIMFAKRRFEEASVIFEDIVEKNPSDYAAQLFLDRAKKFMAAEKKAYFSSL